MTEARVCRLYEAHDLRVETDQVAEPGPGEVLVRMAAGGICGSDLHYFHHGGFGAIRVKEPIILGHEIAGVVDAVGAGVTSVSPGDRVALNPSLPCMACEYCDKKLYQHCQNMRFFGSARTMPHEQGGFREAMVVPQVRCVKVGDTPLEAAAMAEPLAVCLHAVNRAQALGGSLQGARVLVTGAGPIGALTVAAAKSAGAEEVIITDLHDAPLAAAKTMGATTLCNVASDPDSLRPYTEGKGSVDVAFECTAAAPALASAIAAVRPQGVVIQVGIAGDLPVSVAALVGKELAIAGTHRFHPEFYDAAKAIETGAIDVLPILTERFPVGDALEAFALAGDRQRAVKVQLDFTR